MDLNRIQLERQYEKSEANSILADKLTDMLSRDNEKIRGQNDILSGYFQHLQEMNEHLEKNIQVHRSNYSMIKSTMDVVHMQNNLLARRIQKLRQKIEEVERSIEDMEHMADIERKAKAETEETMDSILNTLQSRCKNVRLVSYAFAMRENLTRNSADDDLYKPYYNDSFDSMTIMSEAVGSLSSPSIACSLTIGSKSVTSTGSTSSNLTALLANIANATSSS
jgi:predicted nuclease with TOPRIM domain